MSQEESHCYDPNDLFPCHMATHTGWVSTHSLLMATIGRWLRSIQYVITECVWNFTSYLKHFEILIL